MTDCGHSSYFASADSQKLPHRSAISDSRLERADFGPERVDFSPERTDFRPERAWGEGWTDRQMEVGLGRRTGSPCVLQDFVSFGAAALLPLNLNHTLHKQGTGTTDHLLPLGCFYCLIENFNHQQ